MWVRVNLNHRIVRSQHFQQADEFGRSRRIAGREQSVATITGYDEDVLALFGLRETNPAQLIAKGALEDLNGSVTPVVVEMHGILTAVEPDAWKPAAVAKLKFTVNCRYFRQEIGGKTIHEIDLLNYKRVVNGVDQLAGIRDAIGM